MKVLAKLGLVTAAAATVLFIFIYEFQGPVLNRVMSEPPTTPEVVEVEETVPELNAEIENEVTLPSELPAVPQEPEETLESSEPALDDAEVEEVVEENPVEPIEEIPAGPTRRIYGKITLASSGEQLGGVNIMVPGSTVAKVSNPNGGYTIEVPENTSELVFIYRGKKLTRSISAGNSLVNVALNLEAMEYD